MVVRVGRLESLRRGVVESMAVHKSKSGLDGSDHVANFRIFIY